MLWAGKPISTLSDDELRDAIRSVADIDKNRVDKLEKPRKRHEKLFAKHPPVENETFIQLTNELNIEFQHRKLKEI